jgi:hypothetical protein
MSVLRFCKIVASLAKWHPGWLVLSGAFFGLCLMLSADQVFTNLGASIGLLSIGVVGLATFGRSIALKYAKELAASKAEQDKLNS